MRVRSDIEAVLATATGRPLAQLRADTDRDRVFTAESARDYGLIDVVMTGR